MIDHVWTVVCSSAVIDRETNNISIHNVIERLTIHAEPVPDGALPIQLHIASLWARSDFAQPAKGTARMTLHTSSGPRQDRPELDVNLMEHSRARTIWKVGSLPVPGPGRYTFRIDFKPENGTRWKRVAAVPLEVVFEPPKEENMEGDTD
jgi:hypothetical protein